MCCNKRWVMAVALCGALVTSVHAANVTLTWDAMQRPATLGDPATGTLAFTYNADEKIVKIVATPVDGGTIVVTGDQMDAVDPGTIELAAGGELVFSNKFVSAWNVNVQNTVTNTATVTDARTIDYLDKNLDTTYTTVFKNRNLADWRPLTTGNVDGKGWWRTDNVPTYNIRWEADGSMTAQRQAWDGTELLSVKFQLRQNGDDIEGRVIYAGYWKGVNEVGADLDALMANPEKYGKFLDQGVSTPTRDSGYGIRKLKMSRVRGLPTVRFAGGLNVGGVLYAREYTHLVYERAVTGSVGYGYQADANGILTFRDPEVDFDPTCNAARTAALSFGVMGSGTVEFEATDALYGDETYDTTSVASAGWIPTDWVTVAEDKSLSELTGATAKFGGYSMHGSWRGKEEQIQFLEFAADGQTATGQFQYLFGGWSASPTINRCAALLVEFKQVGNDVQMRVTGARCFGGNSTTEAQAREKYGTDLTGAQVYVVAVSDTDNSANYGIHDVTLAFTSKTPIKSVAIGRYIGIRAMKGSTAVPGCKAQVVVRGTDKTVMRYVPATGNAHVLPEKDGILRIEKGGEAVAQNTGMTSTSTMWMSDAASDVIRVEKDGVFRQQSAWGVGITQRVDLVEGEFRAYDNSAITMGHCKLNLLTFSGNARVYSARGGADDYVRAGYTQDSIWTVRGTAASQCDVGLNLWADTTGNTMTFAVNDVTESAASDFIMNGGLGVNPDYRYITVYKTGVGTIEFNKSVNLRGCPLVLKGGTWLVGPAALTQATDPVTLDGGTLATAKAGTRLGVLTVSENGGGITLGEGATLSFADSSAAVWDTNKVVVTGFAEKSIRFGTSAQALTGEQLNRLRTSEGKRLYMDDDGYLTRQIGMTIFIR